MLTDICDTSYKSRVNGPIAENACVATALQHPAITNRIRFTYRYLDTLTYRNYIFSL